MGGKIKKSLEDILDKIQLIGDGDPVSLANINGKFHALVAKGSGNEYIEKFLSSLRLRLRIVRVTLFTSMERRDDELKEHRAIADSILNGEAELARKAMQDHEKDVLEYVKKTVIPKLYY